MSSAHRAIQVVKYFLLLLLGVFFMCFVGSRLLFFPSHDRDWELGQELLPRITTEGDKVTIEHFRDFKWTSEKQASIKYETRSFAVSSIQSVDVLISHFSSVEGVAHIFLSFELSDGNHVVVSMESRREKGEEFSPTFGMLRQFEMMYVIGSERDLITSRTDLRDERVYRYRTVASPEKAQELFRVLMDDANDVYARPRMYDTFFNNCTNSITRKVEMISDIDFPVTWKTVLPGYFDEVLYEMNVIEADGTFEQTKAKAYMSNHLLRNDSVMRENDIRK